MVQRICIVTCDLVGPIRNGGIGTAVTAFAELMVEAGNDVTVLYPSNYSETAPLEFWIEEYEARGIRLETLFAKETGKYLSFLVYHWLKEVSPKFDVIHFHDWLGIGFWTMTAKRQGLAFKSTVLVCQAHGQTLWHLRYSGEFLSEVNQLETDYMERRSVELADTVFSPSQYMIEWMKQRGWKVPKNCFVAPNILPRRLRHNIRSGGDQDRHPVRELVFFGRLETRKGLELFCEAVGPLALTPEHQFSVTFLGKPGKVGTADAADYIRSATSGWQIQHRTITSYDVFAANHYLSQRGRLAIIASAIENSPYTVLECLAADIPFIAADVGGVRELIAENDQRDSIFERTPGALRRALISALEQGTKAAKLAVDIDENEARWKNWHRTLRDTSVSAPAVVSMEPLVSVCLSTFNRPKLCAQALESLRTQSYKRLEVVLVDDASPSKSAQTFIDLTETDFSRRGWRVVRNENELWTGKSRNVAVEHASGDYILLMDDDNVAVPHEVQTLVDVALSTSADLVTCQQQPFASEELVPCYIAEMPIGFMPIGPNLSQAVYENCLGDLNMMVRRGCWEALGGFTDQRCGCEDYEFLAKAVLRGYQLECVPEILFFYRISDLALAKRYDAVALYNSFMRALGPFVNSVPEELRLGLTLASASRRHTERLNGWGYWAA